MSKNYVNKDTMTMMGTFITDRKQFPVVLTSYVVPEASQYFAGFWYITQPKTESEIKSIQSK